MVKYQWNIFRADLEPIKGSEQAGKRPVLVISAEEINQLLPIVTVLPITSMKPGRKIYSIEVLLLSSDTGLPEDSIAMAHQIRALAKERLEKKYGQISSEELKEKIRKIVKIYLDMI